MKCPNTYSNCLLGCEPGQCMLETYHRNKEQPKIQNNKRDIQKETIEQCMKEIQRIIDDYYKQKLSGTIPSPSAQSCLAALSRLKETI